MIPQLTADTITDDQILALRDSYLAERSITGVDTCDVALERHGAKRNPKRVARARARCAEILNRRATLAHAEKKSAKRLDAEIAAVLEKPKSSPMTTAKLRAAMKTIDPSVRVAPRGDSTWTVRANLDASKLGSPTVQLARLRQTIAALGLVESDHDVEGSRWDWVHVLTVQELS